jgi:hypothetical protein
MSVTRTAPIAALLLALCAGSAFGTNYLPGSQALCANIINANNAVFTGVSPQQTLIAIAFVILATMLFVCSAAYMLGYAFGIGPLLKFSKDEMKEVMVTALIVAVFLGSSAVLSSSVGIGGILNNIAGTSGAGVFQVDCETLANSALNMAAQWLDFSYGQVLMGFLAGLVISIQPGGFGPLFQPLVGLNLITANTGLFGLFTNFAAVMMIMQFAFAVMLGIFYSLFPLFLYAGIVLRTLPWTRAAGGALIGLFISFYFVFPFLVYAFISPVSQAVVLQSSSSVITLADDMQGFTASNPMSAVSSMIGDFSGGSSSSSILSNFMAYVVAPSILMVLALMFSLIISLDFMETLGDMLGSASLSQRNALRGLI